MKIRLLLPILPLVLAVACGGSARKGDVSEGGDQGDSFSSYRAYEHFVKGDLFEQARDYASAAEEYHKALIFDPSSAQIRRSLSDVYFRMRKFTEAAVVRSEIPDRTVDDYNFIGDCLRYANDLGGSADFYRRSLELDPDQLMVREYLAGILYHLGDYKGAEKHYREAVNYSSDKAEAYLNLASFYVRISENKKAQEAYEKAMQEDGDDLRPAIASAALYASEADTIRADSIFSSIIEKNREDVEVLNLLLPALFSSERIDLATRVSARIAALIPDDIDAQHRYGFLLFGGGRYQQAESVFVSLENSGVANEIALYYHGRIRQFDSDFASAEDYFRRVLAVNDTIADAWINLALVTNEMEDYPRALDIMQQAYEKVPWDSTSIVYYTSIIHSRNQKFELAREGYLRLVDSYPDNLDFRFNLGAAYERLGEFEKAETEFEYVLERSPENALALNYLGYMYADRGIKLKDALKMIKKAVQLDPENGAFLDSYAWVLYKLERYDEALVQMRKAMEFEAEDAVLFDHQGDILAALNDVDQARQSWEKALELDPDNTEIKAKISQK